MNQNGINWTAWEFDSPYLIQDHSSFTPTGLDDPNNPWVCNSTTSTAGMGTLVYLYLLSLANGSNLSESGNFNSATTSAQLNGHDQVVSYPLSITLTNMFISTSVLTPNAGLHLTISSTQFTSTSNPSIKLSPYASQIANVNMGCTKDIDLQVVCSHLTNNITYPLLVPAGDSASAVSFFQANPYTTMGTFSITPTINVQIPGNAYAGTYSSTITVAAVSGP
jgi:hypothetical protein